MDPLQERDLRHIWHPCSQMKDYEELPPIVVDHARGLYLYDTNGKEYIDIISSWWCNLLGHCNPEINEAIKAQLDKLEHVIFANFSHEPAIELCERLAAIVPPGLSKFNFADNGSSSVESALKMSFQYHYQTGKPEKKRFMALSEAYHGETLGALSTGGTDIFSKIYKPLLLDVLRVEGPDCYRCSYGKTRESCGTQCFEKAEALMEKHAGETAAFIVEPLVQCAAGMRIYPAEYLQKLRAACDRYGIHLIVDEIATGFGRTGKLFACDHAGISPDIMCISKSLTGGYLPMAITVTTEKIYNAFYADYAQGRAFMHSHTYSGNPLAASAAIAVLKILERDRVLDRAAETAVYLHGELAKVFADHPHVGEIRHIGLINALELVKDRDTKEAFDGAQRTGYQIYKAALKEGLLLRPLEDVLYFNPPMTITKSEIDRSVTLFKNIILAFPFSA
ncbi:adenosylmethionine-8-amino-7-oxononanoate transaminase [Treponema primitia ZAS-2]|uniref:Adenosylmethionine-8-amino-7-oxononanoate aminotransferase n=2 Tax=Treponema primitia TaxID=88058 RepID=F5YMQ3_TREPZ|nr:adenosylmethionine-8-amino-7-oxononanoate transaminase [Treponema primitia ZAS-2]